MDMDERLEYENDMNNQLGPQLALAPLKRLLQTGNQKQGNRKHIIAKGTTEYFRDAVEAYAKQLADASAQIAHIHGRFTIRPEDIETVLSYQQRGDIAPDLSNLSEEAIGGED